MIIYINYMSYCSKIYIVIINILLYYCNDKYKILIVML